MRSILGKVLTITLSLILVQSVHANDVWVTDLTDDLDYNNGTCTLREAINSINQDLSSIDACPSFPSANRILFSKTGSIPILTTQLPAIENSVEIVGPGSQLLNIVGFYALPVLTFSDLNPNLEVLISGLSISDAGNALAIYEGPSTRRIIVQDCKFSGHFNSAVFHGASHLIIRRTTIRSNWSASNGAGIKGEGSESYLGIFQSSIIYNRTDSGGGGIYHTGNVEIDNSTISGNSSLYGGAGIAFSAEMSITNSTITNNRIFFDRIAGSGGGIYSFDNGNLYLYNSILSDNEDPSGDLHPNYYSTGSGSIAPGSAYNLIGVLNPPFDTGPFAYGEPNASNSWIGSTGSPLFALLNPLDDNGGPTLTHSFQSEFSLPVDQGNCFQLILDQRGFERGEDMALLADPCDMGAVERDSERALMGLGLKVFIDGALDGSMMRNDLQMNDKLDELSPYSGAPWNHTGQEEISLPFSSDIVDWILVELSEGGPLDSNGLSRVESHAYLLSPSGFLLNPNVESDAILVDPGYYWITVHHRNHLSVTSSEPVYFDWWRDTSFDFTDESASAYSAGGLAQRYLPSDGVYAMWGGDGNANGSVSAFDFIDVWLPNNGEPSGYVSAADFNLDGTISAFDFLEVWLAANGQASQTP